MTIIPLQDYLCQKGDSRMNFPSNVSTANWSYRAKKEYFTDDLAKRIKNLVTISKR